jgi:dolichyl-phosphate beta-glucosyltransferase
MIDPEQIADSLNTGLIVVLIIAFIYVFIHRFVSDVTLYDRTVLPPTSPLKLSYSIEPPTADDTLPSVFNPPDVYTTFVIPAYNEETRLPPMIDQTIAYLASRQSADASFTWEIIIVDDGSRDQTANVALGISRVHPEVRLLRQPVNMGKGAAVQAGCLHARGRLILMIDADGATKVDEFGALEKKLLEHYNQNKKVVVVGSRAHLDGEDKANRTALRKFLGLGFHFLTWLSGVRGVKDTQCGFKLFSREAARWLFPNQHVQRWCFDAELLVIAKSRRMAIAEVPVEWNEIEGSKMKVSGMVKMAIDMFQIAVYYRVGLWTVKMKGNAGEEK